MISIHDIVVVVPTLNAGELWKQWLEAYRRLEEQPRCLIIDSSSTDDTVKLAEDAGIDVHRIDKSSFDHGGTRNLGMEFTDNDIIVFLTQDAILEDEMSLRRLVVEFGDEKVAAVYGRQLPRPGAGPFESFLRLKNYPDMSYVRSYEDRSVYGLRTAFMSNSFAAYRRTALEQIQGFPEGQIFGEDMVAAARFLKLGWKVAYAAEARVLHSHKYSPVQEFRRYFDMGVLHAGHPWIRADFGTAESAGVGFVIAELGYIAKRSLVRLPEAFIRTMFRFIGFRLGLVERYLPHRIKQSLAMNRGYFS